MKRIWLTVPHTKYEGDHICEAFAFADEAAARKYAELNATGRNGGAIVYEVPVLYGVMPPRPVFDCERYSLNGESGVMCFFREFLSPETDLKKPGTFVAVSHDEAIKAAAAGLPDVEEEE